MIEVNHRPPPQHLWRWDGPYVWVGRMRIAYDNVLDDKVALTREQLADTAKIIWMQGFNTKTDEVKALMRTAASEFSHFKHLLPPEVTIGAKKKPPAYWLLLIWAVTCVSVPTGIVIAEAMVRGLSR